MEAMVSRTVAVGGTRRSALSLRILSPSSSFSDGISALEV